MSHTLPHLLTADDDGVLQRSGSVDWLRYFLTNAQQLLPIPWEAADHLSDDERQAIARSIQTFQLGESSEGTHLMKVARVYAERIHDPNWVPVVKLFIGEEQRHARDLARFMKQQGLPLAKHQWSDGWFRRLRRLSNLEMALMMLFTAELIATLYYRALGAATRSPILQQLCQQILHDETQHVHFQIDLLRQIRRSHPRWRIALTDSLYSAFFRLTVVAVWFDHRSVLQASRYTLAKFYADAVKTLQVSDF